MVNVYKNILKTLKYKRVHMTLIDPAAQSPERSSQLAEKADKAGTDFFLIGGSTDIDSYLMDKTIKNMKEKTDKQIIIFPGSRSMISKYADAIYYMMLMNSTNIDYIVGHQIGSARILKMLGIETIPMGYLIFEPGMTVGRVGNAKLIGRDDEKTALSYAFAAEFFGFKLLYLEAGSGAPEPVGCNVIKMIKNSIKIPVIVGGGIRDYEKARAIIDAGADIIVTGTVIEKTENPYNALKDIINAI
ncbi:geranylgeranylglyceryl/heptaprenylglyceryl phosphate synthase [Ferroplasma sp.]|uniref:geranylgeranylglyceryl/heptaprenylglyceryl phosphate synthase n=1 Tax=Ferroplasma sp. TaxID=2591003 RepID=UPI00307E2E96